MRGGQGYWGYNGYRAGNAYFICDRCSQRWRRSRMQVEWDNLRVCPPCLDPRPPQMQPPDVYPEGMPFLDARPPGDLPDRLVDDAALQSIMGGITVYPALSSGSDVDLQDSDDALVLDSDGATIVLGEGLSPEPQPQYVSPGQVSPRPFEETPLPYGPSVLADDVTFITGPVSAPVNT